MYGRVIHVFCWRSTQLSAALVLKISDLSRISEQNKMTKNIKDRDREVCSKVFTSLRLKPAGDKLGLCSIRWLGALMLHPRWVYPNNFVGFPHVLIQFIQKDRRRQCKVSCLRKQQNWKQRPDWNQQTACRSNEWHFIPQLEERWANKTKEVRGGVKMEINSAFWDWFSWKKRESGYIF